MIAVLVSILLWLLLQALAGFRLRDVYWLDLQLDVQRPRGGDG